MPSDRKADNGSSDDVVKRGPDRAPGSRPTRRRCGGTRTRSSAGCCARDFWTPTMSDVDWDGVLEEYRFLLDRIRTSAEFGDLLWEVAGELGTSHAYVMPSGTFTARSAPSAASPRRCSARTWPARPTAAGWWSGCCRASRPTRRPARRSRAPGVAVREGDEILAVDGRPLDPVHGPWPALAGTARQAGRADHQARRPVPGPPWPARAGRRRLGRGRRRREAEATRTPDDRGAARRRLRGDSCRGGWPRSTCLPTPRPTAASADAGALRPDHRGSAADVPTPPPRRATPDPAQPRRPRRRARVPRDPPRRDRPAATTTAGSATRTGWPAAASSSAPGPTAGSATCTCPT